MNKARQCSANFLFSSFLCGLFTEFNACKRIEKKRRTNEQMNEENKYTDTQFRPMRNSNVEIFYLIYKIKQE